MSKKLLMLKRRARPPGHVHMALLLGNLCCWKPSLRILPITCCRRPCPKGGLRGQWASGLEADVTFSAKDSRTTCGLQSLRTCRCTTTQDSTCICSQTAPTLLKHVSYQNHTPLWFSHENPPASGTVGNCHSSALDTYPSSPYICIYNFFPYPFSKKNKDPIVSQIWRQTGMAAFVSVISLPKFFLAIPALRSG